ncbi:serine hydrolase [Mycobacterium sp.]|uniref:serine hydrolase n=1 Tax=Mycobacterium sp. TaxID=1785 RepID=UPI003C74F7BB
MTEPQRAIEASFEQLCAAIPATVGVAIAAPGAEAVYSLGEWSAGVAWSTIKVPLAIAALRHDQSRAAGLVAKMITESDNAASETLWSRLGDPGEAARQVQAVIREAGDSATVVESRRLRPGFTPFGQTQWTLSSQARFAANLARVPGADAVIHLMHHLVRGHRWGLAAKGIAVKGGWGPGVRGDYLVRQFAIMPIESGQVGVALAAEADAFETGVDVLNTLAGWLVGHLPALAEQ